MRPPILTVTLNPAIDLHLEIADWRPREVTRARRMARAAGGKGVNVARVLGELGVAATAAVALGGPDAAVYRALLAGAPFEIAPLLSGGVTRTNVTVASSSSPRRLKINQPGPVWSRQVWQAASARLRLLVQRRHWVILAGALPPGVPSTAYGALVRAAHRAGARCAVDAAGASLRGALAARPDLVRINREELAGTLGLPVSALRARAATLDAARSLLNRGAAMAAITNGPGEALLVTRDAAWHARPPRIAARGVVGAGDAMLAGLLTALFRNDGLAEALRLGLACGAAHASQAETFAPTHRRIGEFERRITVAQQLEEPRRRQH